MASLPCASPVSKESCMTVLPFRFYEYVLNPKPLPLNPNCHGFHVRTFVEAGPEVWIGGTLESVAQTRFDFECLND